MGKRVTIIGIAVVVVAVVIMIVAFAGNNTSYYYEVSQYQDQIETLGNKNVRVHGDLAQMTEEGKTVTIVIADIDDASKTITASYSGPIPAQMRNQQDDMKVTAEGKYDFENNILMAKELIMECASKYEPAT